MSNIYGYIRVFSVKPQEVKPKAQTDWSGFCKGVRTYVRRTSLMIHCRKRAQNKTGIAGFTDRLCHIFLRKRYP